MSTENQGMIAHDEDLIEIEQTESQPAAPVKKKFNIGDYNREKKERERAEKEALGKIPSPPLFTQPAQKPAAPVKKKREAPSQYIFRFVKPPDKKIWDTKVSGRTYLPIQYTVNWPYHVIDNNGAFELKAVDIRDEVTNIAEGETNGTIIFQPRTIRYIASERSIFVDDQERGREQMFRVIDGRNPIIDNLNNREPLLFQKYEARIPGTNHNLVNFFWCCPQCANMNPKARRYGTVKILYELLDFGQAEENKISRGKLKAKMYELASTARDAEMIPHAKYLNIPFVIPETNQRRDIDAIREDYKDMALANPEYFEKTFTDPKVKIIHMIAAAQEKDELGIGKIVAGQAHWMRSRQLIAMIPPDRNPLEYLADFMLTQEGVGFASQLKAWWQINGGTV